MISFQLRGHADLRLVPVVVRHADGAEHGSGGRLLHPGGDVVRAWLQVGHGGTLPRVLRRARGPYCGRGGGPGVARRRGLDRAHVGRRPRAAAGERRRLVVGLARHPHRRRPAGRAGPPARAVGPGRGSSPSSCWPRWPSPSWPTIAWTTADRPTGRSAGPSSWSSASSARRPVYPAAARADGRRLIASRARPPVVRMTATIAITLASEPVGGSGGERRRRAGRGRARRLVRRR